MAASRRLQRILNSLESIGPKPRTSAVYKPPPIRPSALSMEVSKWKPSYITKTTPKKVSWSTLPSWKALQKEQRVAEKKIPGYSAVKESLVGLGRGLKETYDIARGRPATLGNIAKTIGGGLSNILVAPFEMAGKEAEYLAAKTPFRYLKTKTPLGELTAPAAIGLAASLAMPVGAGGQATKIAKLKSSSKILKELFKIKSLKGRTTEEMTVLANKLVKVNKPSEVTKTITKFAEKPAEFIGKERGFVTTVRAAKTTAPQVKKLVKGRYEPITNLETQRAAQKALAEGYDIAKTRVYDEPLTAETNLIGQEIMKLAQNAGKFDEAAEVAEVLARKGTEAGQSVQAFSVWSRLTPEGMLRYAQKQIQSANKNMGVVNKLFRTVFRRPEAKLTAEDSKIITQLMKKSQRAGTEEEKAMWIKRTWEHIGKKLPWGISDVLDEYRYANMLSNPLTHLRNAWSNTIQTFITRPATLAAEGRPLETIRYELAALKALPEALTAFGRAVKKGETFKKMDITRSLRAGPVKPRRLGRYNLPTTLMEAGDRFFSAMIRAGELARGTPADEAARIAEYSLFRAELHPASQGAFLNSVDNLTKAVYGLRQVGLGWFIPFIRTPMNIAKQWIEFSPAGLATIPGAANKRTQLAKSIVGSMVTLVGADMALKGRTTWEIPSDPEAKRLFYDAGKKPFSVKVGNRWVPLQTFGVFAWALGLPAAFKYYAEETPKAITDTNLDKLSKLALSPIHFWSQQTFVSGLGAFVSLAQGKEAYSIPKNIAFTASQMKPMNGLLRYVANVIDPVFRKASTLEQQLKSDLPFLTKGLPAHETSEGEPARRDPASFFLPYAQGEADPKYQRLYEQRMDELRNNARTRLIQSIYEDMREGNLDDKEGLEKIMKIRDTMQLKTSPQSPGGAPTIFP